MRDEELRALGDAEVLSQLKSRYCWLSEYASGYGKDVRDAQTEHAALQAEALRRMKGSRDG